MMTHDYTEASTEEDPRMMAFFDSLVQRELEGWSSDDTLSSNEEEMYSRIVQMSSSDTDTTISSISSLEDTLSSIDQSANSAEANIHEPEPVTDTLVSGVGVAIATSTVERATSSHSSSRKGKNLSKLIKRKKEGIKDSFYRNRSRLTLSSSSDTSSDEDNIETMLHTRPTEMPAKGKHPINVQNIMKKKQQALKESFVKLKRLRTLRNQILDSDSDTEISFGTKVIEQAAKLNDDRDSNKDFQISHHKTKKNPETTTVGPYVHEMCHMFEAGSSSDVQVCSSSGHENSHASEASTKCGHENNCDNPVEENVEIPSIDKSNHLHENKWKPVGVSNSCLNSQIIFHNKTTCDSDDTLIANSKHVASELNKHRDSSDTQAHTGDTASEGFSPTNVKELASPVDDHGSKCVKSAEEDSFGTSSVGLMPLAVKESLLPVTDKEKCDSISPILPNQDETKTVSEHSSIHLPSQEKVKDASESKSVFMTDKVESNTENHSDKVTSTDKHGEANDNSLVNLSSKIIRDNTSEVKLLNLQNRNKFDNVIGFKFERNGEFKEVSSVDRESKVYDSAPSCSSQTECNREVRDIELTYINEHKPHSPEVSRVAWTEFKKRRKSEHSKKHYRNHKSSEKHKSWD